MIPKLKTVIIPCIVHKSKTIFFFCYINLILATGSPAKTIYISPGGNDQAAGTVQDPLASLEGARDMIRAMKGEISETIEVIILEGDYYLKQPVYFGPEDGGTEQHPIVYKGVDGKEVNFFGARRITGFEKAAGGLWKTQLEGNSRQFEQLYVNGKRAVRARTPNIGSFFQVREVKETVFTGEGQRVPSYAVQEIMVGESVIEKMEITKNSEYRDVLAVFYHKWDNTRKYINELDTENGSFFISGQGMKPWNKIDGSSRFYIENVREALDAPGEWFLEKDGTLYYMPYPDEEMGSTAFFIPLVEQFMVIKGESRENKIQNLHFKNLNFKYSGYATPKDGNEPAQAAAPIPSVIMVDWADNLVFEQCEIAHTGMGGIWFRDGVENSKIQQCYLHDLGAGGIKIGPFASGSKDGLEERVAKNNIVDNNIIRSGGWVFPCAVGAMIFHASDNELTHNEIADFRYSGVSVGWVWGYSHSFAKRNKVKYNHIHHLGWGDLSDMGGVYTLGPSEGTEVSHNIIHHVYSMTYGGWGLYTDEGSTGIVMENNLVYACKNAGFHQHYGKDNHIRNNIFAYNLLSQLQATRVEDHNSFYFTNNIILFNQGTLLSSNWAKINLVSDENLYWDEREDGLSFSGLSLSEWKAMGNDKNSMVVQPLFLAPHDFDFSFKRKSAIRKIDFKPFDTKEVGVYGSAAWKELAKFDKDLEEKFDKVVVKNEETSWIPSTY